MPDQLNANSTNFSIHRRRQMQGLSRGMRNGAAARPAARGAAAIAAYLRRAILDRVYRHGERMLAEALGILEQDDFITRRVGGARRDPLAVRGAGGATPRPDPGAADYPRKLWITPLISER
jgi:hypothetical protein